MKKHLLSLLILLAGLSLTSVAEAGPGLGLYGNWCGPGNSLASLPPVDPLDEACMHHDICYVQLGVGACECDLNFMAEIRSIPYPGEETYVLARAMYDALAMTPCDDPTGWALKQSWLWRDVADDAISGRATPFEVPARWMYLFSRSNPYY